MNICLIKSFKELLNNKFKKDDFKDNTPYDRTKKEIKELATKLDKSNSKLQSAFLDIGNHALKLGHLYCEEILLKYLQTVRERAVRNYAASDGYKKYDGQMATIKRGGKAGELAEARVKSVDARQKELKKASVELDKAVKRNTEGIKKHEKGYEDAVDLAKLQFSKVYGTFDELRKKLKASLKDTCLGELEVWGAWSAATLDNCLGRSFDKWVESERGSGKVLGWNDAVVEAESMPDLSAEERTGLGLVEVTKETEVDAKVKKLVERT